MYIPVNPSFTIYFRNLIRIIIGHILDSQGCKVSSRGQLKLCIDCADVQVDLNLRVAHLSEGTFYYFLIETFFFTW